MLMFVVQDQPHSARTDLRRKLVACLLAHGSTFSRVGASDQPGAVHLPLFPSIEAAWREVDSSFERFCLTAGIGAIEHIWARMRGAAQRYCLSTTCAKYISSSCQHF